MASTSSLRQLFSVLRDSIEAIEAAAERQPVKILYPNIDDPFDTTNLLAEQFVVQPEVMRAADVGVAAASQLAATLKLPVLNIRDRSSAVGSH